MKKIFFTLVFCVAACLATAFAQVAATSAGADIAPSPRDGDSIAPANNVPHQERPEPGIPEEVFSFESDASFYYFTHKSTVILPDEIRILAGTDMDKALSKLEEYKKTLKTKDPLLLLLWDADFYEMFRYDQQLGKTYRDLVQKLKSEYGDRAEVIRFEIDELADRSPKNIIEIAEHMIKSDPKYLPAYFIRGREYFNMGETEKFCEDFDKLPEAVRTNDANYKRTCKK